MSFIPHEWKDRDSTYPHRRKITDVNTQEESIVDVTKEEGTVFNEGVQFNADTMNGLETRISQALALVEAKLAERLDSLYPIGSIYLSDQNISPATIFGGTWASLSGGVLLPSISKSRLIVGEDTKNLNFTGNSTFSGTVGAALADCPNHSHSIAGKTTKLGSGSGYSGGSGSYGYFDGNTLSGSQSVYSQDYNQQTHTHNFSGTAKVTGTLSYSNMMPSITIYAWERTA